MTATQMQHESKRKLLDAAMHVIRSKGYTATRVEDVCEEAGLTKGSFFHHFKSKEELAVAAAEYWSLRTGQLFGTRNITRRPIRWTGSWLTWIFARR